MNAMKRRKSARKQTAKTGAEVVKVSVPLPPEVWRALNLASLDTNTSNTKLIEALVAERFSAKAARGKLRLLAPENGQKAEWKRVSVFLPVSLKMRAAHEVRRQHGSSDDKRFSGSLASALAALVAEKYSPDFTF